MIFNISIVDLEIDEEYFHINMTFEKETLLATLYSSSSFDPQDKALYKKETQSYLKSHSKFKINGTTLQIEIEDIVDDDKHINVKIKPIDFITKIKTIEVFNDFLLETHDDQVHVIQLHQADLPMRGFKIDKSRKSIFISL